MDPSCQGQCTARLTRWPWGPTVPETQVPETEVQGQGDAERRSETVAGSVGCLVAVERILESLPTVQ